MKHTDTIAYTPPTPLDDIPCDMSNPLQPLMFELDTTVHEDHIRAGSMPHQVSERAIVWPWGDINLLRLCIQAPYGAILLPSKLAFLKPALWDCIHFATAADVAVHRSYMYLTIRHGQIRSTTDDEWHVDGYSRRVEHNPELNFVWANSYPMEWQDRPFSLRGFDHTRDNIHRMLQEEVAAFSRSIRTSPCTIYAFTPYLVHRRPPESSQDGPRSMFRLTICPVEIEDDTCSPNPLLPMGPYNNTDIRDALT